MATTKKKPVKAKTKVIGAEKIVSLFRSREERFVAGNAWRDAVPRQSRASWKRPAKRRDPIDVLERSDRDRVPELVPIPYECAPAGLPSTQFLNFGIFATPRAQSGGRHQRLRRDASRAHAKSGDAATISGYLGKSDIFDQAIGEFAFAYADQTERDHAALVKAARSGRVEALMEEDA